MSKLKTTLKIISIFFIIPSIIYMGLGFIVSDLHEVMIYTFTNGLPFLLFGIALLLISRKIKK